jgi:hypothetical protein
MRVVQMTDIILKPYDSETRIRIAETMQHRAVEQSIKDAGNYVAISMRCNKLTAENVSLKRQVAELTKTIHAMSGYPRMLALPEVEA